MIVCLICLLTIIGCLYTNKSYKTIETVSSFASMKFLRKQKTTLRELKIHINSLQILTQTQNLRKNIKPIDV